MSARELEKNEIQLNQNWKWKYKNQRKSEKTYLWKL